MLPAGPRRFAGILLAILGIGAALPSPLAAQGDLLIAPTRLILDGRRGGEVILSNIGDEEIVGLEIPTGQPIVYELGEDLSVLDRYYLADRA